MNLVRNILTFIGLLSSIVIFLFFFPRVWGTNGSMFDWTTIKSYPNNNHRVEAIVRYGVPNDGSNTVPFYSVVLQTMTKNKNDILTWEVWSSQHKTVPTIKWINDNYVEIIQMNDHIWEYTPTVIFNKQPYKIRLNILP